VHEQRELELKNLAGVKESQQAKEVAAAQLAVTRRPGRC
jgi:hypothetical protein